MTEFIRYSNPFYTFAADDRWGDNANVTRNVTYFLYVSQHSSVELLKQCIQVIQQTKYMYIYIAICFQDMAKSNINFLFFLSTV